MLDMDLLLSKLIKSRCFFHLQLVCTAKEQWSHADSLARLTLEHCDNSFSKLISTKFSFQFPLVCAATEQGPHVDSPRCARRVSYISFLSGCFGLRPISCDFLACLRPKQIIVLAKHND